MLEGKGVVGGEGQDGGDTGERVEFFVPRRAAARF